MIRLEQSTGHGTITQEANSIGIHSDLRKHIVVVGLYG